MGHTNKQPADSRPSRTGTGPGTGIGTGIVTGLAVGALLTLAAATTALSSGLAYAEASSGSSYHATVRRGPYGVPHISADDFGSLGYGEAYVAAEDHVCTIAYGLMEGRSEKARFLGPGKGQANIVSDAVIRALGTRDAARSALAAQSPEIRQWLTGYAAGYNRYLREHTGARNTSWCSGAPWLREATADDLMTRMVLLTLTLPRMAAAMASTSPPDAQGENAAQTARAAQLQDALESVTLRDMGSNGWALGSERTENGRGLLLANPHYPWYGGARFWEKHLTIPGELNSYGVGLLGIPGVAIGFNQHLGWTHTVSASQRLVFYRLTLDPDNPMRYRFGDGWREIEGKEVEVQVADGKGGLVTHKHTLYFSHHGPLVSLPNMGWDQRFAYAARDANVGNYQTLSQWLAMGTATTMDEFIDAHRTYNAMPWVNTIAASEDGRAVYLDNSSVGKLGDDAQGRWRASLEKDPLAAGLHQQRGMVLLDGSDPDNEWLVDEASTVPGTTPFDERPRLERRDYVFNANDSYWLSNPAEPMTGASILYGPTETPRSLRTRMNVRMLSNYYKDAGDDGRFSIHEVQGALFDNRGLTADLLLEELTAACESAGKGLQMACEVLANYDGSLNLDSPGAVLFREWLTRFDEADMLVSGPLFERPFDLDDPTETPVGLGDEQLAMEHLAAAVAVLEAAELPLHASLRDAQFAWRAGQAIPVHGGNRFEGVANLQIAGDPSASPIAGVVPEPIDDSRFLTSAGYPIVHGSSFIMTLGFDDRGPVAEALLSYSQSGNPRAPHFRDQTDMYAAKEWRKVAFHPEDVTKNTTRVRVLRSEDER